MLQDEKIDTTGAVVAVVVDVVDEFGKSRVVVALFADIVVIVLFDIVCVFTDVVRVGVVSEVLVRPRIQRYDTDEYKLSLNKGACGVQLLCPEQCRSRLRRCCAEKFAFVSPGNGRQHSPSDLQPLSFLPQSEVTFLGFLNPYWALVIVITLPSVHFSFSRMQSV